MMSVSMQLFVFCLTVIFLPLVFGEDRQSFTCGDVIDGTKIRNGIISSPGYPKEYLPDLDCKWTLVPDSAEAVLLTFSDFDVTGSENCEGDHLEVIHGNEKSGDRFCGDQMPDSIKGAIGETLHLSFWTNERDSCKGFNLTFTISMEFVTCGESTDVPMFNFVSPGYPEWLGNDSLHCKVKVGHECGEPICQLRLDFEDFELQPPFWGDCKYDRFYADANGDIPTLCGMNNGTHIYLDVAGKSVTELHMMLGQLQYYLYNCYDLYGVLKRSSDISTPPEQQQYEEEVEYAKRSSPFERQSVVEPTGDPENVTVALYKYFDEDIVSFPNRRAWRIRVTQIPCSCTRVPCSCSHAEIPPAPYGCLQYYQGLTGNIKSFNYDGVGCYSEDHWCNFNRITDITDCDIRVGYTGHLNNLDYGICIAAESGFCGIEYNVKDDTGFTMTNNTDYNGDLAYSEAGDIQCMSDYVMIPAGRAHPSYPTYDRFCGSSLGVNGDTCPISSFVKPFVLQVVADADELSMGDDYMNRGFHLSYKQLPCQVYG